MQKLCNYHQGTTLLLSFPPYHPQHVGFLFYGHKMAAVAPVIMTLFQHPKQGEEKKKRDKSNMLFLPRSDILVPTESPLYLLMKLKVMFAPRLAKGIDGHNSFYSFGLMSCDFYFLGLRRGVLSLRSRHSTHYLNKIWSPFRQEK